MSITGKLQSTKSSASATNKPARKLPYSLIKPPNHVLKSGRKCVHQHHASTANRNFSLGRGFRNKSSLSTNNRSENTGEENNGTNLQLSYIDHHQIHPYISLKSIHELYEALQVRNIMETPLLKAMKNKDFSLTEFIGFVWDKCQQDTATKKLLQKDRLRKRNTIQFVPIIHRIKLPEKTTTKLKTLTFGDYINMFKDKLKQEQSKHDIDIKALREKGTFEMMKEVLNPSLNELNPVKRTREACREYYLKKIILRNEMLKRLDNVASDRPFAAKFKKKCLADNDEGSIKKESTTQQNLTEKLRNGLLSRTLIGAFRVTAEKERIKKFKEVLSSSATFYYKTIVEMLIQRLPKTENLRLFADYMKNVIENGVIFTKDHLMFIIKEISIDRMSKQEIR